MAVAVGTALVAGRDVGWVTSVSAYDAMSVWYARVGYRRTDCSMWAGPRS